MDIRVACAAAIFVLAGATGAHAAPPVVPEPGIGRATLAVPAGDARVRREKRHDDCRPYNGPFGYYGNPWCDGGFKYQEDFPEPRGILLWSWPDDRPRRYRDQRWW